MRVLELYKRMLWLGQDWHQGQAHFTKSLSNAFRKNKYETSAEKIEKLIFHAEFVEKEVLALYQLKKYRSMKNRYGDHGSYAVECQRIMEAARAEV